MFSLFSPPRPVTRFHYRCDNHFHLDELLALYAQKAYHALVLISGKEVRYYKVAENETVCLKTQKVELPNRHHKGGQSSVRFARLTEEKRGVFVSKVVEEITQRFSKQGRCTVETLILAGPGELKEKVAKELTLFQIKLIDTPEIQDNTIHEVLKQCDFNKMDDREEKKALEEFHDLLRQNPDRLVFGAKEVSLYSEAGLLSKVLGGDGEGSIPIHDRAFQSSYGTVGIKWHESLVLD